MIVCILDYNLFVKLSVLFVELGFFWGGGRFMYSKKYYCGVEILAYK